ncbi:MAG: molybdenum cofactor guanylyltransferase [Thermoprotei archaeon]|nr:molybdenum cofactor guanylyltransferase [Thermoprotei archaeon]
MKSSLIILSGGLGRRVNFQFKPFLKVCGKPLIKLVLERLFSEELFEEVIVVVKNDKQKAMLEEALRHFKVRIVEDEKRFEDGPLVAIYTGAKHARMEYVFIVAVDYPLMTADVAKKMLLKLKECDAVIPEWPNGFIEPLVSAYRREKLVKASYKALLLGMRKARAPLEFLERPCLVSVFSLSKNPEIVFTNVNTLEDLLKAEKLCSILSDRVLNIIP